jgi:hypothetical protein
MSRRNILVVHGLEDLRSGRRSSVDHIVAFQRYAPDNNYHYHMIYLPVPEVIRQLRWDAVIFSSTALGFVTVRPRDLARRIRNEWRFLRRAPALKLAFPQDDAMHGALLDLFFCWLGIDAVFTVLPEQQELLYPLAMQRAAFFPTFAGYIDDASATQLASLAKPFEERRWEVGQRVTMYPAWGGGFARLKGLAAMAVKDECRRRGLAENISVDPADLFLGDDWYRFLGDCRFVVGAEGGHSLWDPYGVIQDSVNDYVAAHPAAPFEEIADECFPGLDGRFTFPAISPRVLEAALMGCGQILVEGAYAGVLVPNRHFIPMKPDFANLPSVFEAMRSRDRVAAIIAAANRDIAQSPRYRLSTFASEIMDYIDRHARAAGRASPPEVFARDLSSYNAELVTATVARGRAEEGLKDEALRSWARARLAGQFDDAALLERLVGGELPTAPPPASPAAEPEPLDAAPAPAAAVAPETLLVPPEPQPQAQKNEQPAAGRLTAAMRRLAASLKGGIAWKILGLAGATTIAVATYPIAVLALQHLTAALHREIPMGARFSTSLALSLIAGYLLLPAHLRPFRSGSLGTGVIGTAAWVAAGHGVWLAARFFSGSIDSLERDIAFFTAGTQGVLALAASAALALTPLWLAWGAAMIANAVVFGVAAAQLAASGGAAARLYGAAALFVGLNALAYHAVVVRRGLDPRSPRRYGIGVLQSTAATHLVWIFGLFASGALDAVPRLLPLVTATLQIIIVLLPAAAVTVFRHSARLRSSSAPLEVVRGPWHGNRTAWLVSHGGASDAARAMPLDRALVAARWRVVVCGFSEPSLAPRDCTSIRFDADHHLGAPWRQLLCLARSLAWLLSAIGPRALNRWAAPVWHRCHLEQRHFRKCVARAAKENPDLKPDLVIACDVLSRAAGDALARLARAKFVVDCAEDPGAEQAGDGRPTRRAQARAATVRDHYVARADLVTTASAALAEQLDAARALSRPAIVVRAVPIRRQHGFRPTGRRIKVLYRGTVWHARHLHSAVRSMPMWRPEFDLILEGDGDPAYIAELRRLADRHGLERRLSIVPAAAEDQIVATSQGDIGFFSYPEFAQPSAVASFQEFLQYVAAGLAVCVPDFADIGRLTRQYRLGQVIARHSPEAIAAAINGFTPEEIDRCKRTSLAAAEELGWDAERTVVLAAFDDLFGTAIGDERLARTEPHAIVTAAAK